MLEYNKVLVTCPPFRKLLEEESKAVCPRTDIGMARIRGQGKVLGQGIANCVYTNNGFDLQSKIHATQSDFYLLILSMSLMVDIYRAGAVTQDFIMRTAPIFSFCVKFLRYVVVAAWWLKVFGVARGKQKNLWNHELLSNNTLWPSWKLKILLLTYRN